MPEAYLLTVGFPVLKAEWDAMERPAQDAYVHDRLMSVAELRGEPLADSYDDYQVSQEAVVYGLRLNGEDEMGNPLPERVFVRADIHVIPNEESLKEILGAG